MVKLFPGHGSKKLVCWVLSFGEYESLRSVIRDVQMYHPRTQSGLILGIDEAGRGPILGPMVLACVSLTEQAAAVLYDEGVTDSKKFGAGPMAHQRRQSLVPVILRQASYTHTLVVDVEEIDARTSMGQLNQLEQEKAETLILSAPPAEMILADGARLFGPLREKFPHLQAVNHAESMHVAVAAASVLAKVKRDQIWQTIVDKYRPEFGGIVGPGGGYANPGTKRFLRSYCAKYQKIPPEGRRSWPWDFVSDLLDSEEYRRLLERGMRLEERMR